MKTNAEWYSETMNEIVALARGEQQWPDTHGREIDGVSFEALYRAINDYAGGRFHIAAGYNPKDGTFLYRELYEEHWVKWDDGIVSCGDWSGPATRQEILDVLEDALAKSEGA